MTGQELIDKWMAFFRRYVVLTEQQALVVSLWAINTWVYDRFAAVPYLEIFASTKQSGKSTLLSALKMVTRGAEKFAIVRILTILRMIEAAEGKITVLVDEAEQFSKPSLGEVRSGVASGYQQGAQHAVSVGAGFQRFRTFAPWAFAQIGNVHDVLRDRCIEIELERSKPAASLTDCRDTATAEAQELIGELLSVWAAKLPKHGNRLPIVSADWLTGRERELWTPLVSIAHFLDLHADTVRALQIASVDLGALKSRAPRVWHSSQDEKTTDDRDAAERLLADILTLELPAFIPSAALVDTLRAIPTAPWRSWRGDGLNEILLAALLDRYGIGPVNGQVGKGRKDRKIVKGYKAAEFAKAQKGA